MFWSDSLITPTSLVKTVETRSLIYFVRAGVTTPLLLNTKRKDNTMKEDTRNQLREVWWKRWIIRGEIGWLGPSSGPETRSQSQFNNCIKPLSSPRRTRRPFRRHPVYYTLCLANPKNWNRLVATTQDDGIVTRDCFPPNPIQDENNNLSVFEKKRFPRSSHSVISMRYYFLQRVRWISLVFCNTIL